MKSWPDITLCLLLPFFLFSCGGTAQSNQQKDLQTVEQPPADTPPPMGGPAAIDPSLGAPYALLNPSQSYELPTSLMEVSAVAYVDEGLLGMVQDERGRIYFWDEQEGKVSQETRFKGEGDYEGFEIVADKAYALRSDGVLFSIEHYQTEEPKVTRYDTPFSEADDTEGLAYDYISKKLLIACKEVPIIRGKRHKNLRGIFTFDMESHTVDPIPFMVIDMMELKQAYIAQARTPEERAHASAFDPDKKSCFKPSDLAIHPNTGDIYVIATKGELLVVMSRERKIKYVHHLPRTVFSQPEGICFGPNQELYISNEGRSGRGSLLRFDLIP